MKKIFFILSVVVFLAIGCTKSQVSNNTDTTVWKKFDNNTVSFQYPNTWASSAESASSVAQVNSEDGVEEVIITSQKRSEMDKSIGDWYQFNRDLDNNDLSNERAIEVGEGLARTYDINGHAKAMVTTNDYVYILLLYPNEKNSNIENILKSVKF